MKTENLTVELAERTYPIYFSASAEALKADLSKLRTAGRRAFFVSDARVLNAHPDYLGRAGVEDRAILSLPSGESTKSVEYFSQALSFLAGQAANRDAVLFAFGGGVVGDLAGYVAASYLRGIDFYQIPTTLLSMVDSSVGGKTGINLPEGKNLVGAFWQPRAVYVDSGLLATLPPREFAAGMAEVIKYGMLADAGFLAELESYGSLRPDAMVLNEVIRRCCAIKAQIVAEDEKETAGSGGRALLNLGHTFAHAIENVAGYGTYLHGEAVAIGLVLATRLSVELGQIEFETIRRIENILLGYQLPIRMEKPLPLDQLMAAMQRDKKNRGGKMRFVTIQALGQAITSDQVEPKLVEAIWAQAMGECSSR